MEEISSNTKYLLFAVSRGYTVNEEGAVFSPAGKEMSLHTRQGYLWFRVWYYEAEWKRKVFIKVHRLVAYDKFGDSSLAPGIVVRHLDGDRNNNSRSNIEIGTDSQNSYDRPETARVEHALKAARETRKLSEDEVRALREERKAGATYLQLREKYGLAKSTISYIVRHKVYKGI